MEACKLTVENARLNGVSDRLEVLTETWDESKNSEMSVQFLFFRCLRLGTESRRKRE